MDEGKREKVGEAWKEAAFILAAFAVVVLGYLAWKFIFYRGDFSAAAKQMRSSYSPGDAVAIFPSWLREEVFDFDGMAVVAPKEGTYVNFQGFGRLWTVTNKKYAPDRFQLRNEVRPVKEFTAGDVVVRLYELPPFNASAVFPEAGVYVVEGGMRKPCERIDGGKWKCGREHWQFVGPTKVDIAGQSSECIWAHPMAGRPIEIEFPMRSAFSSFYIFSAFTDTGAGGGSVPSVRLALMQGGRPIKELIHPQHGGWAEAKARFQSESGKPLTVRVETEQEGRQHWCFNIEAE